MTANLDEIARQLAAARAGDASALGELFKACHGYLLLVARTEFAPELQAKGGPSDVVQDTFLEAQRDFPRFQGTSEEELLAWLRRLLLNNLANFTRQFRDTGKRAIDREVALGDASSVHNLAAALPADTPSPSGQAVAREAAAALQRALDRLPDDYRQVLVWRYQEKRSFDEIAALLKRTPNAARKLWARALERLQEEMETTP
jgi:RNA polymerase sigma-70 factor (ECF subfamily)